ncbi:MAG: hypothetical protein K0B37_08115 [Bacteroidales bacterium]|nr:hypothetical protein [Bacteroidales bacterium]
MKTSKLLTMLVFIFFITISSCELFEDDDGMEDEYTYELFTNPSDPTIVSITTPEGIRFSFFGTKDNDGVPETFQLITALYPGESEEYIININEDGTPGRIITPTGSTFELAPLGEKEYFLKVVSASGEIRLTTVFHIDSINQTTKTLANNENWENKDMQPRSLKPEALFYTKGPGRKDVQKSTSADKILIVNVTHCGYQLSDYTDAILTMTPLSGLAIKQAAKIVYQPGIFIFQLPDAEAQSTKIREICEKVGQLAWPVCIASNFTPESALCPLIKQLIDSKFSNSSEKNTILAVCDKAIDLLPTLCEIHDKVGLGAWCEVTAEIYLNPNPDQFQYQVEVFLGDGGAGKNIPLTNFDPNTGGTIDYDIAGVLDVISFITIPFDPNPGQGYVAEAEVICPSPTGTSVEISIVGSDGYTNSSTVSLTKPGVVSLNVPGGAENVKDVITVKAAGNKWETFIVF